ncbi:hypothetical protein J3B02_001672 [Coemansia erecta]|uniref:ARMC9 CTLH-like domain-containing protein n=1 Tax=Coemansia asiatica TaxID=1052880 RepID=A0A9W7XGQ1_9FUNG|nr:hypothetical protein LPJ64_005305 [Coemansia asiatica]KAJ2856314.1 hypothetical protein J3B02_001672 [Coemansia erecta]KAJ2886866.1 hypothetical protein FB639_001487 [Coemansia asiatica]
MMPPLSPSMVDYVQSAKAGIESVQFIDDLIREYLLFRGFKSTLMAFEEDLEKDQDKGFSAEYIVDELLTMAKELRVDDFLDYWKYLTFRFFSHLSPKYHRTTKMFEARIIRLFLVSAIKAGERMQIRKFMDVHGHALGKQGGDWIPWLGIEYVENPAGRPEFQNFFSDHWFTSLRTALVDFVQTIFPAMAVPRIMLFDKERRKIDALKRRIKLFEEQMSDETRIKTLEATEYESNLVEDHIGIVDAVKSPVIKAADTAATAGDPTDIGQAVGVIHTDEPSSMLKISREDIFLEHNSGISLAKFSVTGDLIASYDDESILKIWSPDPLSSTPKMKKELDFTASAMTWDRKHMHLLYLYDEDGFIHTLNTNTNLLNPHHVVEKRHPWIQAMRASSISSTLLTVCSSKPESTSDLSLRIWDASANKTLATKRLTTKVDTHGISVALNHNGNLAVLAYNTGFVKLLDTRSFETVAKIDTKQQDLCAIEFSMDEDSVIAVTEEGRLTQWSLRRDNQMLAESTLSFSAAAAAASVTAGLLADLRLDSDRVAFTSDRESIVVAPKDQCLVFNVDSAAMTDATRRHKDLVSCIDFAADKSLSASDDGTIRIAEYRKV